MGVEVAELEGLVRFLDIPIQVIWKDRTVQAVGWVIHIRPGEIVQVMAEAATVSDAQPHKL